MTSPSKKSTPPEKKTPTKAKTPNAPAQSGPTEDDASKRRFPGDNAQAQGVRALKYEGETTSPSSPSPKSPKRKSSSPQDGPAPKPEKKASD